MAHEGIELQFSVDGGLTWIPIVYFSPGGFQLPQNPGTSGSVATGFTPYILEYADNSNSSKCCNKQYELALDSTKLKRYLL
ncbi:MAG: hypothetical protein DCO96_04675 [Fluviicola sp. XM-24bin1]|nr:MAG: hypothetical protein DCO96_04675 [Fluviicola sp. XM-24bin1]